MIGKRLLAIVLAAFLIVCFFSAPVLSGNGDEDPWDVDATDQGGSGGIGAPGGDQDSTQFGEQVVVSDAGSEQDPDGNPFETFVTKFGYGTWSIIMSWFDEVSLSKQAVAGNADGGSASVDK